MSESWLIVDSIRGCLILFWVTSVGCVLSIHLGPGNLFRVPPRDGRTHTHTTRDTHLCYSSLLLTYPPKKKLEREPKQGKKKNNTKKITMTKGKKSQLDPVLHEVLENRSHDNTFISTKGV